MIDAAIAKVAEKRIAGTQGQERHGRALDAAGLRKEAVHDLVGSAIAADGNKVSYAARIRRSCNFGRIPRGASLGDLNLEATGFQALQCWAEEFTAASSTRGGIYDCEIVLAQWCFRFLK